MRVFLLTGEPSGDLHGAYLAHALQALDPRITLTGIGGTRMREAGVPLVAVSEHWGAMGVPESLRKVPLLYRQFQWLKRLLLQDPPDVLVPIDFGAFNVRLLRSLRGSGIKSVYYIPPGCWSRRKPAGDLPWLADAIATPFSWSAENLRAAGGPARIEWVGHPLLDYCRTAATRQEARQRLGIDEHRPVVALLPGSRRAELRLLLPGFLTAVRRLSPAPLCLLSVAPSLGEAAVRPYLPAELDIHLMRGIDYDLLQAADAALVTSGTATLELACLNLPMVVAYRSSALAVGIAWVLYRGLSRHEPIRYFSLPNIIADAPVVPELFQRDVQADALVAALTPLLTDTDARRRQITAFNEIRASLGDGTACARTATLVREVGTCLTGV
ncbi:MAG: lipid-A-disaccharide synthase [Armatimonadota bacterium]